MTTAVNNGVSLATRVSQLIEEARQAGEPAPGRPTLAERLGVTEYQVRKALAELGEPGDASNANTPPPIADETPAEVTDEFPAVDAGEPGEPVASPGGQPSTKWAKAYAIIGFIFGSVTSVAFNVLAARIPPENAPKDWQPNLTAEVFAAVWPLALLISVEVISRVSWPKKAGWQIAKFGGIGLVAVGAAVISYQHIQTVLASAGWGYNGLSASVGPLVMDGLMILSGFGMLAVSHQEREKAA